MGSWLFNPLNHFLAGEEVVNTQSEPACAQYEDDKQQLFDEITFEAVDLQSGFDCQYKTDNPNYKSNHNKKVFLLLILRQRYKNIEYRLQNPPKKALYL
jgi:hypothetical protein